MGAAAIIPIVTTLVSTGLQASAASAAGGQTPQIPQSVTPPLGARDRFKRLDKTAGPWQPWDPNTDPRMMDQVSKGRPAQRPQPNPIGDTWQPFQASSLADVVSRPNDLRPPLAHTPSSIMAGIVGPQQTVDWGARANPPASATPGRGTTFGPAVGFSGEPLAGYSGSGVGATGGVISPTLPPVDENASLNKWLGAAGAGFAALSEIDPVQQRPPGVQQIGGKAPDVDRYVSGHGKAQADFAASVMERYLRGGGYA